jgi:hypothetical protein
MQVHPSEMYDPKGNIDFQMWLHESKQWVSIRKTLGWKEGSAGQPVRRFIPPSERIDFDHDKVVEENPTCKAFQQVIKGMPLPLTSPETKPSTDGEGVVAQTFHFGLSLQTQPTGKTCVQTCLAMALGIPVEKVIQKYGDDGMNQTLLQYALTECGFVWNHFTEGLMIYEGWYFVCVPSLNKKGGTHQILVHYEEGEMFVLDPAQGVKYKEDGSDLISWNDLTPFWKGGQLKPTITLTEGQLVELGRNLCKRFGHWSIEVVDSDIQQWLTNYRKEKGL